jgi:hypothetical protein
MSFSATPTKQFNLPFEVNCSNCLLRFLGYCAGEEKDLIYYFKEHESLISCTDLNRLEKYLFDVLDTNLLPPKSFHQNKILLPSALYGIKDGGLDLSRHETTEIYAVSLSTFIREENKNKFRFRDMAHLKRRLKIPDDSKVCLIGTSNEKIQQILWKYSEEERIWQRMAEFGFYFISSMTYPVWDENPRSDQIINQLRNYFTADVFASLNVPTVPFIYPFNEKDYETFGNWIEKRPDLNKLAVLATFYKSDEEFAQLVRNMKKIEEYAQRNIQFLIVGATLPSKIELALSSFGEPVFISWAPYCEASVQGNGYLDTDLTSAQQLDITRNELCSINFKMFSRMVEEKRNKIKGLVKDLSINMKI